MKIRIVILIGLLVISGFVIAQEGFRPFWGSGQINRPFRGAYSGESQPIEPTSPFHRSMQSEHIADMSEIIGSVYSPNSEYSSTIMNPFWEESYPERPSIYKSAPGDGKPTGSVTPVGDAVVPMLVFLLAYGVWKGKRWKCKEVER